MPKESWREVIRIRGARQNNLKGFDLELPARQLIVITGLSGSGKSSLAFDTLYAEGQRRYIETFSPYARQFFDRMDKPRVDAIEGIPPAIALEQRNSVRTTRSTVGTMTEICDHMKVVWPRLARLHCRGCGKPVSKQSPRDVWNALQARSPLPPEALVTFRVPLSTKLSLADQLALIERQGFQRLLLDGGNVVRISEAAQILDGKTPDRLVVVQDRVKTAATQRARFVEACEQAYHFGHGRLALYLPEARTASSDAAAAPAWGNPWPFSLRLHCAECDIDYAEPGASLFSFNHPLGACPECKGFGRVITIDYTLAIPDRSKTLAGGAVRPWQSGTGLESQADLMKFAKRAGIPVDVPFRDLPPEAQRWVIEGDPDYGEGNEWPHAWYGVKGYFRWLESKAYKMHVRVLLSRYRAYRRCPACQGRRLQPDALLWRLPSNGRETGGLTLADFYALPVAKALECVEFLASQAGDDRKDPVSLALREVRSRLQYLADVGVGYLTLDRPTRTLSGGETQRVNLTSCLGARLVNSLFVLDEPSVGLHARDTERLVRVLSRLRDLGNTVVVVEHEAAVMRAADQIIDLGPGHGEEGGQVVAQGAYDEILANPHSLTGAYLSGRREIPTPKRRPVLLPQDRAVPSPSSPRRNALALADNPHPYSARATAEPTPSLALSGVTRHNLKNLDARIPLGRFVCLSGVSGSGKTTLASELLQLLRSRTGAPNSSAPAFGVREAENEQDPENGESPLDEAGDSSGGARLDGAEHIGSVLLVDQSPIGRTPRSNPAVYSGAFDPLRELFALTTVARQRDLGPSAFSFNSRLGQCEQCRGAGFEKIEMQFLSDVFIRCPACNGRRYRPHILEARLEDPSAPPGQGPSIADVLDLTVDKAIALMSRFGDNIHARRAAARLRVLQDVGLGYLQLGQPVNTLSGGESQRLKLAGHLAEFAASAATRRRFVESRPDLAPLEKAGTQTLFIFDEPTTGLHFEDIRILLEVFHRLVDEGHSVLIIEHNLEVLKSADWILDLGPGAGDEGGRIVVAGPPEVVAACPESPTGAALRSVLGKG